MLVLLSPAKTINETASGTSYNTSLPDYSSQTEELLNVLQACTQASLQKVLGVSATLASLNHTRYKSWTEADKKAAAFAFDGPAYKALDAASLTENQLKFAQQHIRVIDALYGLLKPLDLIKPYRLEMSNKLTTSKGSSLYAFWGDTLTESLNRQVREAPKDSQFIINCASQEYFKAVNTAKLDCPVYTMCFPGPAVHAKAARGGMVRFIVQKQVCEPQQLQAFTGLHDEWSYDQQQSSECDFVFIRSNKPRQSGKQTDPKHKDPDARSEQTLPEQEVPVKPKRRKRT